jgi:hypothetical protein
LLGPCRLDRVGRQRGDRSDPVNTVTGDALKTGCSGPTQYVDRIRVVREKGVAVIKEVPVYVPAQADAACTINRGFVRLHDAAAAGELPEPARDADAPAAGIALSAVAGTVAANYQTCHENAEQLRALQVWVGEMTGGTK